jgi:hypothetical protein
VLELMEALSIPKGVYTSTLAVFSDTHGRVPDETHRHYGGSFGILVMPHHPSPSCCEHALFEQIHLRSTVHLALQHL